MQQEQKKGVTNRYQCSAADCTKAFKYVRKCQAHMRKTHKMKDTSNYIDLKDITEQQQERMIEIVWSSIEPIFELNEGI
jgi:hypothetical protein